MPAKPLTQTIGQTLAECSNTISARTLFPACVHLFTTPSSPAVHAAATSRTRLCSACGLWAVGPSRLDPDR